MIWNQPFDLPYLNGFFKQTLGETLGMQFTEIGPDYLVAKMPVDHRTVQPYGLLHGGASVALAETLGSVASTMCIKDLETDMAVGVEINANHLRPATKGFVFGTVKPLKVGRSMHIWNIEIQDEKGRLVCVSRLTIAIIKRS